jgi:hypothetical protein
MTAEASSLQSLPRPRPPHLQFYTAITTPLRITASLRTARNDTRLLARPHAPRFARDTHARLAPCGPAPAQALHRGSSTVSAPVTPLYPGADMFHS